MNFLFVCLAAHESEASSMDSCKRQTATATPAEPGELPSVLDRGRVEHAGVMRDSVPRLDRVSPRTVEALGLIRSTIHCPVRHAFAFSVSQGRSNI